MHWGCWDNEASVRSYVISYLPTDPTPRKLIASFNSRTWSEAKLTYQLQSYTNHQCSCGGCRESKKGASTFRQNTCLPDKITSFAKQAVAFNSLSCIAQGTKNPWNMWFIILFCIDSLHLLTFMHNGRECEISTQEGEVEGRGVGGFKQLSSKLCEDLGLQGFWWSCGFHGSFQD